MFDLQLYVSFLLVSSVVIIVPGPNVLVIIATSLAHGRVRALQTIAGTLLAMAVQLVVAAKSTAMLAAALAEAFSIVRWFGVAYLAWLGVSHLRAALRSAEVPHSEVLTASGSFRRGLIVGITNPKTILFFGAFLPQFTIDSMPMDSQIAVLSLSFLILAALFDSLYAMAAGTVSSFARRPKTKRWLDGTAGALLLGSGVALALVRRS